MASMADITIVTAIEFVPYFHKIVLYGLMHMESLDNRKDRMNDCFIIESGDVTNSHLELTVLTKIIRLKV